MINTTIIIPTHSDYKDIVQIFIKLLRRNWPKCPYPIVVSVTGEPIKLGKEIVIYNGEKSSLIECIKNAANKYKSDYYISFLGDALIVKQIDDEKIKRIMDAISNNKIEYCSLNMVKKYAREKRISDELRYINELDRYSHSFVSFIISNKFLNNELTKFKNDLEFEKYYLNKKNNQYYKSHAILRKNYLNIRPSIYKGRWDKINYDYIKKHYKDIEISDRRITSLPLSIALHARSFLIPYVPNLLREKINNHRKNSA